MDSHKILFTDLMEKSMSLKNVGHTRKTLGWINPKKNFLLQKATSENDEITLDWFGLSRASCFWTGVIFDRRFVDLFI